jgi:hypothetical protein
MHNLLKPKVLHATPKGLTFNVSSTGTSPDWHTKSAAHWLAVCRSYMLRPGQVKMAELGGSQDTPFEQAFSNLAHTYIKDRAPKLLDYEVGFQLLEKNQENTKAVGVFGFKIGNNWVYVPVFFLNGDMKGHELMYIKHQDQFLPLKENWINQILGKKPSILGSGVNRNLSMLGIMPPNLYQLSRSPHKFASHEDAEGNCGTCVGCGCCAGGTCCGKCDKTVTKSTVTVPKGHGKTITKSTFTTPKMASWFRDFLPTLAHLATTSPTKEAKYNDIKGLPDFLKEAGPDLFITFVQKVGQTYPILFNSIDQIYGSEMLTDVARSFRKSAALAIAGDPKPANWNGGLTPPTKVNGGITSFGKEAWESSHIGRRYVKRHGGAMIGHIEDMERSDRRVKNATYPGCGSHLPRRPIKSSKPKKQLTGRIFRKRASIIPSEIGPIMSQETKHRVISLETIKKDPDIVHSLKADERETLLKERVVLQDKRDGKDVTIAYDVQTPMKLTNPDHTGIYIVLVKPDQFERCLIVMGPYNHRHRQNFATVVRLSGQKNYTNTHPANIWVIAEEDADTWKKWLDSQKDANSIPVANRKDPWKDKRRFILLGPTGQGSCPFQAREEYTGDSEDSIVYDVRFEDHNYSSRPAYLPDHSRGMRDFYEIGSCDGTEQIILTKRPGIKMSIKHGVLLVPDNFKIIQVRDEEDPNESNNVPIQLGTLLDAQLAIMSNTHPLRIVSDGRDVTVNENRMDKLSALIHLFNDHGLSEKVARHLIDKASSKGVIECRLIYPEYMEREWDKTEELEKAALLEMTGMSDKMAVDPGNDMIRGAPNAPPFPEPYMGYDPLTGGNVPTMQESEFNIKIPDMSASKTDRSIYYPFGPDPKSMQVAQQAAQTGQREVFDTAMLGSLLKAVRQDNIVDRYMGDLMKGLDRLGRILFLYYWHGEEFEDRYGKQDMPELEDGLRNAFEGIGDIILALKRKSVEPFPEDGTDVDLGPVANQ